MSERKPRKITNPDGALYRKLAIEKALSWCPPIYPCNECGGPVVDGYTCGRCGNDNPVRGGQPEFQA